MASDGERSPRAAVLSASPPIFGSPVLDRLTRVHHVVPVLIFMPTIAIFVALALDELGPAATAAWVAGGYVFWTLVEYWGHRAVFHFEPADGLGARLHWMIHGVHHDHPNDPKRLVLPPAFSVPLASAFALIFIGTLGRPTAWAFGAGFFGGYLAYDMLHYALHHHKPTSRLGKTLRELHMRHHFQDDTTGFGVSAPWWDVVFGTSPRRKSSARRQ